jgi:hypothetical protein
MLVNILETTNSEFQEIYFFYPVFSPPGKQGNFRCRVIKGSK